MATKRFKKNSKLLYSGKLWQCLISNNDIAVFCRVVNDELSRDEVIILDQDEPDLGTYKSV
jgi:hypothetical protein